MRRFCHQWNVDIFDRIVYLEFFESHPQQLANLSRLPELRQVLWRQFHTPGLLPDITQRFPNEVAIESYIQLTPQVRQAMFTGTSTPNRVILDFESTDTKVAEQTTALHRYYWKN